jgi:DNA adenine methylase
MQGENRPSSVPFLKWAGGKRWLTATHAGLFAIHYDRYVEPFLGSGAVFFHLRPRQALLSDSNPDLINVYTQIRSDWPSLEQMLREYHENHSPTFYYQERSRRRRSSTRRAAQFLYFNRVCWNGLYRVNLKNQFNVPIGTKTSVLLATDDFEESSRLLQRATLVVSDFEPTIDVTGPTDFVFIDPPYVTLHNFNGFAKYNDRIFSWSDQERLASAVRRAASRGAKILLTNADHPSIRELYHGVGQHFSLRRHSVLAGDPCKRGATTEMAIIVNYNLGRCHGLERH